MKRTAGLIGIVLVAALLLVASTGCKKKTPKKEARTPWSGPPPQELVASMSERLPGDASLYLFVDLRWAQHTLTTGWTDFIVGATLDLRKATAEIAALCKRAYGVDCTKPRTAAGFASFKTQSAALILFGDLGGQLALKKVETTSIAGRKAFQLTKELFVTQVGRDQLWLGNRAGLTQLAEVRQKKLQSLATAASATSLRKLLGSLPKPRRGLAVLNLTTLPLPAAFKLELAAIVLDTADRLQLSVTGPQAILLRVRGLIGSQLKRLHAALVRTERASKKEKNLFIGILAALSLAHLETLLQAANLPIKNDTMSLVLDFRALQGFVPLMGMSSAVGIPAFIRYIRKAKASEALENVNRITKAALVYASSPKADADGTLQKCQFPESVGWTPKGSPCAHPGGKYPADANVWTHQSWRRLLFQPSGSHYYQYRVVRSGMGNNSTLTIEARGDLDCDGTFSLFRQTLTLTTAPDNESQDCRAKRKNGYRLHIENEVE